MRQIPLFDFFRRWKSARHARQQLDSLLAYAQPEAALVDRNQWLIELAHWIHGDTRLDEGDEHAARPIARLRYLLTVLDRNPAWQARFIQMLRAIFHDLDAIALLCDTGLAQNPGYWGEFRERLLARLIPPTPNTRDWSALLTLLFPRQHDAEWLEQLDSATLIRLLALFKPDPDTAQDTDDELESPLHAGRALPASIAFLVTQIQASGLQQSVRSRMDLPSFDASPFLSLARSADAVLNVEALTTDQAQFLPLLNLLRGNLDACREAVLRVFDHLEENGINVDIVFQVERILSRIRRVELLLDAWLHPHEPVVVGRMLTDLIRKHQEGRSVVDLTRRNFSRLARKVVQRSAETGEHYIARDATDYRLMLHAALGGGVITAFTVYLKFFITALHLPKLAEGLLSSLNYAGSFLTIHFAGFTLATKQPAMTAPALASKLGAVGKPEGLDAFVQETICLIRSQFAAIFGNLAAVTPIALAAQLFALHLIGHPLISPEKAASTVASFSILGATPFFAMFTGVLLWLSSLCAGWADNWFVYRKIGDVIAYHRRLRWVLGERGSMALAQFWRHHISGVAGNVALGVMLALVPLVFSVFLPFDLEVRHVTLSTGSLAAALGVLGWNVLTTTGFWLAVAGIASMGLLNLAVSFALAFQLALRSHDLRGGQRWHLYGAVLRAVLHRPLQLFFPVKDRGTPIKPSQKLD